MRSAQGRGRQGGDRGVRRFALRLWGKLPAGVKVRFFRELLLAAARADRAAPDGVTQESGATKSDAARRLGTGEKTTQRIDSAMPAQPIANAPRTPLCSAANAAIRAPMGEPVPR